MAAGWRLLLSLTLCHSLVLNLASEGPFPSASIIKSWVDKMQEDLVTLARTASGVDQLAKIYMKNNHLYTVEANNARDLVEFAARDIEKLLSNRSKALVRLATEAEIFQASHQWRDEFGRNDIIYYNAKDDQNDQYVLGTKFETKGSCHMEKLCKTRSDITHCTSLPHS